MKNWPWYLLLSVFFIPPVVRFLKTKPAPEVRISAMNNAKVTASATGGSVIDCSGIDSDMDDYVTCSIKSNTNVITEIQCSLITGGGCKITKREEPRTVVAD